MPSESAGDALEPGARFRRNVAIAAAYAGLGELALGLAVPPGYGTPVWLPAGIALVAAMLWGKQVWPAVFVGSCLVNTALTRQAGHSWTMALATGGVIATGATLQAALGAWLARRYLGPGNPLERGGSLWMFLLLGGPVASVASAVWGTLSLLALGRMSASTAMPTLGTWWVGDTIGVLLCAPPLLAALANRRVWGPRRWVGLTVPLLICLVGVWLLFTEARASAETEARERFEANALIISTEFAASIDRAEAYTESVAHVFYTVEMTRADFRELVGPWIAANRTIEAFEWLPVVPRERLAAFEAAATDPETGPYRVWEVDASGQKKPVEPRDLYTPILFVEPLERQRDALGYDLHSNPARRAAEEAARDTGQVAGTGPVRLVLVPGEWGALLIAAAYPELSNPTDVEARRRQVAGYVATVIRVNLLAGDAVAHGSGEGLVLRVTDQSASPPVVLTGPATSSGFSWETETSFGGRAWKVEVLGPKVAYWSGWAVLAAGLACTGLVTAFVVDASARAIEVERQVAERTATLAKVNEALRRSNLELQRFAYVASHDMREPLRTIGCYSELLDRRAAEQLSEEQRGWLRRLVRATRRMQELIDEILAFSRTDTRAEALENVPLAEALRVALDDLERLLAESSATVTAGDLPSARCDRVQVAQVFLNLLSNAIKFRRPGAPLRIVVTGRRTSEGVEVAVEDNGIGIDPQHFGRVFEMFQRLNPADRYPGHGIGLATCRRIVERHGGRIWVESQPGIGSVFHFTLPGAR